MPREIRHAKMQIPVIERAGGVIRLEDRGFTVMAVATR